jgi:hypothetical protein
MKTAKVRPISGAALVISIVSIFALGACGGSDGSGGSSADSGSVESMTDSSAGKAAAPEMAAEDADAAAPNQAVTKASIISTGSVALRAKDVGKTRTQVQHISDRYAGQVTEQETSNSDDDDGPSHARMVLRIPSKSFAAAMADLEETATLVDSNTMSTDVTTEVVDTEVRVKNARTSIERIRTLLSRAEAIGDVIAIESELARREADLNSLLAQQAALEDQTSLSTITVNIERAGPGDSSDGPGFLAGLSAGWDALGASARVLAVALGAIIPWTPILLLVVAPVWFLFRRRRQAAGPIAEPAPTTSPAEE